MIEPRFLVALLVCVLFFATALNVFAQSDNIKECEQSDFELKIGNYVGFFEFSKSNKQPSLKYLICKYKGVLDGS